MTPAPKNAPVGPDFAAQVDAGAKALRDASPILALADSDVSYILARVCLLAAGRQAAPQPESGPDALFEAIKHGDADHQRWLRDALTAWFAGKPVPAPYGSGSKEARIATLEAALREKDVALEQAGKWFRQYERIHLSKEPPDTHKAQINANRAGTCEAALTPTSSAASGKGEERERVPQKIADHCFCSADCADEIASHTLECQAMLRKHAAAERVAAPSQEDEK